VQVVAQEPSSWQAKPAAHSAGARLMQLPAPLHVFLAMMAPLQLEPQSVPSPG
jgi:hypothetical protein